MITEVEFNDILVRLCREYEVYRVYVSRDFVPQLGLENINIIFVSACGKADDIANLDTDNEDLKTLRRHGARLRREQEIATYLWDITKFKQYWNTREGFNISEKKDEASKDSPEVTEFKKLWEGTLSNMGVRDIYSQTIITERDLKKPNLVMLVVGKVSDMAFVFEEVRNWIKINKHDIKFVKQIPEYIDVSKMHHLYNEDTDWDIKKGSNGFGALSSLLKR